MALEEKTSKILANIVFEGWIKKVEDSGILLEIETRGGFRDIWVGRGELNPEIQIEEGISVRYTSSIETAPDLDTPSNEEDKYTLPKGIQYKRSIPGKPGHYIMEDG